MKKLLGLIVLNQNKIRDFVAIILYKLNLIPKEYSGRVRQLFLKKN